MDQGGKVNNTSSSKDVNSDELKLEGDYDKVWLIISKQFNCYL
jgi:hypothetical protein